MTDLRTAPIQPATVADSAAVREPAPVAGSAGVGGPAIDALRCRAEVRVAGAGAAWTHRVRVGAATVTLDAPGGDGDPGPPVAAPTPELTTVLFVLAQLGPRPRLGPAPAPVDPATVVDLLSPDGTVRADAARTLADGGGPTWSDGWRRSWSDGTGRAVNWRVTWPSSDPAVGPTERGLLVVDTPAGLAVPVGQRSGRALLVPTDPTTIWLHLLALVPGDDELGLGPPHGRPPHRPGWSP